MAKISSVASFPKGIVAGAIIFIVFACGIFLKGLTGIIQYFIGGELYNFISTGSLGLELTIDILNVLLAPLLVCGAYLLLKHRVRGVTVVALCAVGFIVKNIIDIIGFATANSQYMSAYVLSYDIFAIIVWIVVIVLFLNARNSFPDYTA